MIQIRGFENYEFCCTNVRIFSKKTSNITVLKEHREGPHIYFYLFKNGKRFRKTLWDIFLENWDKIEDEIRTELSCRRRLPEHSHNKSLN